MNLPKLSLVVILLLIANLATSQKKWNFGLDAGIDYGYGQSNINYLPADGMSIGYHLGLKARRKILLNNIDLDFGLGLIRNNGLLRGGEIRPHKNNILYAHVNAVIKVNSKWSLSAGVESSYLLHRDWRYSSIRPELGLSIGAEYKLRDNLFLSLKYSHSLTPYKQWYDQTMDMNMRAFSHRGLQIGVVYMFR